MLKKRPYDLCFPLNIDQLLIESISIPYCVLESKALLTIFAKNVHGNASYQAWQEKYQDMRKWWSCLIGNSYFCFLFRHSRSTQNHMSAMESSKEIINTSFHIDYSSIIDPIHIIYCVLLFPWIFKYRLNLYPLHIVYWSLKLFLSKPNPNSTWLNSTQSNSA